MRLLKLGVALFFLITFFPFLRMWWEEEISTRELGRILVGEFV